MYLVSLSDVKKPLFGPYGCPHVDWRLSRLISASTIILYSKPSWQRISWAWISKHLAILCSMLSKATEISTLLSMVQNSMLSNAAIEACLRQTGRPTFHLGNLITPSYQDGARALHIILGVLYAPMLTRPRMHIDIQVLHISNILVRLGSPPACRIEPESPRSYSCPRGIVRNGAIDRYSSNAYDLQTISIYLPKSSM